MICIYELCICWVQSEEFRYRLVLFTLVIRYWSTKVCTNLFSLWRPVTIWNLPFVIGIVVTIFWENNGLLLYESFESIFRYKIFVVFLVHFNGYFLILSILYIKEALCCIIVCLLKFSNKLKNTREIDTKLYIMY